MVEGNLRTMEHSSDMKTSSDSSFLFRHIGLETREINELLSTLGVSQLDDLIEQTLPRDCHLPTPPEQQCPLSESEMQQQFQTIGKQNTLAQDHIGQGYYPSHLPPVIKRHVLENPNWYTAYTPYQAEISQGRLEGLFYFQEMVKDLTGLPVANASLLDEATAAAEAMILCHRKKKNAHSVFFVDEQLHPQIIQVIKTRAEPLNIPLQIDHAKNIIQYPIFAAILAYCGTQGRICDPTKSVEYLKQENALVILQCDPMALLLLQPPSHWKIDIAIGHLQRFGLPLGFGGPHPAFIATTSNFQRHLPGRIIGQSVDSKGKSVFRMALQTREQHIRREKATSNICTAQALLANMVTFYAMYHGANGLRQIANKIHRQTQRLAIALQQAEFALYSSAYFDTITVALTDNYSKIQAHLTQEKINVRSDPSNQSITISLNETTTDTELERLIAIFLTKKNQRSKSVNDHVLPLSIPTPLQRSPFSFTHSVFEEHHSETAFLRYLKRLEAKDYTLCHGMIPLGSCTMKLNAVTELEPLSQMEFSQIHPFAPTEQTLGYQTLIQQLEKQLCALTGFDSVCFQPNSGAQGEYAGLLTIRRYLKAQKQNHRNLCFIPASAHGTNPASAQMAGFKVINIPCDEQGNIDFIALSLACERHGEHLAAMMITYPSTHGIFEKNIQAVCQLVHQHGGQIYLDGANLNAQLGITNPVQLGADVSHFNLHKTFCIPHGGGGPGMGPIGVKSHLTPFLPDEKNAISATPFGSASLLTISHAYLCLMGTNGITLATKIAILNANYIMQRLSTDYSILYRGENGWVAHECLLDIRPITQTSGITEEDIAKRLMDYGFHAPTMSFPVKGTLMIEPTESENKKEMDRFCDAMIAIRQEIKQIENKHWSKDNNPLVNAPHTQYDLWQEHWDKPYSREQACFPTEHTKQHKFWPTVNRIDNAYGDRCLLCR
jgi:glycine dehydrogenase